MNLKIVCFLIVSGSVFLSSFKSYAGSEGIHEEETNGSGGKPRVALQPPAAVSSSAAASSGVRVDDIEAEALDSLEERPRCCPSCRRPPEPTLERLAKQLGLKGNQEAEEIEEGTLKRAIANFIVTSTVIKYGQHFHLSQRASSCDPYRYCLWVQKLW